MDSNQIMNVIPHRPPFLLVDRILELSDKHVVGMKNVTMNEDFFVGHFPFKKVLCGPIVYMSPQSGLTASASALTISIFVTTGVTLLG